MRVAEGAASAARCSSGAPLLELVSRDRSSAEVRPDALSAQDRRSGPCGVSRRVRVSTHSAGGLVGATKTSAASSRRAVERRRQARRAVPRAGVRIASRCLRDRLRLKRAEPAGIVAPSLEGPVGGESVGDDPPRHRVLSLSSQSSVEVPVVRDLVVVEDHVRAVLASTRRDAADRAREALERLRSACRASIDVVPPQLGFQTTGTSRRIRRTTAGAPRRRRW